MKKRQKTSQKKQNDQAELEDEKTDPKHETEELGAE